MDYIKYDLSVEEMILQFSQSVIVVTILILLMLNNGNR